jgi:hypothetical protein
MVVDLYLLIYKVENKVNGSMVVMEVENFIFQKNIVVRIVCPLFIERTLFLVREHVPFLLPSTINLNMSLYGS